MPRGLNERSVRMKTASIKTAMALAVSLGIVSAFAADISVSAHEEPTMTMKAKGPFDVKLAPQALAIEDKVEGAAMARLSIDKQFHGDLEASSKGEMLSAAGSVKGSAGYVAIEKVSGTLGGRKGTFVLQHNATMTRGTPYLNIIVVPDSGTGELAGLTGTMKIDIAPGGAHSYELDYAFGDAP